jgi:16S rRNA (guanine527-N7)-methyltransferase
MYFEKRIPLILELGFRERALPGLKTYVELLWAANEELNLFSRKMTYEELIDNHVIDCLLPIKHFPTGVKTVADFGSGGGMPAVIYALHFSEIRFQLYEKSPKKQEFLNRCRKLAPNIEVLGEIPKLLSSIDLVTARAFKPLDVILEVSRDYFKRGGKYFLLKARKEKIDEELAMANAKFKDLKIEVIPLQSPLLDVERHLVLI